MAGFTNKGKYRLMQCLAGLSSLPASFNVALITSAVAPTAATNTFGQLTEIPAGNGYTAGGINITRDSSGFIASLEDDSGNLGSVTFKDLTWTAIGGPLPASGSGARYAVLRDNNVTLANSEVWGFWDLVNDRIVSAGQPLTLTGALLQLTES